MLQKITIENYRCFNEHEVEFKDLSIVVGKNNAGKSTLIEALRLVSLALSRFRTGAQLYAGALKNKYDKYIVGPAEPRSS